jgi:hypothetical protein
LDDAPSRTRRIFGAMPTTPRHPAPARYQRLKAWQACHELTAAIYRASLTPSPPESEVLRSEMRDSAMRATVAIVVGASDADPVGFAAALERALGLLARLDSAMIIAKDVGELAPEIYGELETLRDHAEHLTRGLFEVVRKRRKKKSAASRAGS